jgi:U3 small nucleolar RNA-associated protein 6
VVARQKILGLDEESQKRKSIQEAEIDDADADMINSSFAY